MSTPPVNLKMNPDVLFIDIGGSQETHFTWINTAAGSPFSKIDVIAARTFPGILDDYIHLKRKENKLVFRQYPHPARGFNKLFLVIGATMTCQYQVMEAYIDFLRDRWFERFGDNASTSSDAKVFESFAADVYLAFEVVPRDLVKTVKVHCKACNQFFDVQVKKTLIDTAESFPVPLVFEHANHALLIYIDKNYHSRGESIVNITG